MKLANFVISKRRGYSSQVAIAVLLFAGLIVTLGLPAAFAQCVLSSPDTWSLGSSGNWNNASHWSTGVPNSSSTNVCITDGSSTVTLDINASVASLQLASGNALDFNGNTQLVVYGSQILNAGQINVNGGGNTNSYLYLSGGATTTLSGGGTVTLNTTTTGGGGNAYLYLQNGTTLVNVDNTIKGEGYIYNNGTTITNQSGGTINANSSGSPLVNYLALEYGQVNNAGLLEATNSGDLQLYQVSINNQGGNITANGANAFVDLQGANVQGGAFNTLSGGTVQTTPGHSATLDGSTGAGAVTINGSYLTSDNASTNLFGSIVNNGNFQVSGGGNTNAYLYVPGNVTLTGGGTVTLQTTTAGGGGDAWLYLQNGATLDNVNNTIQGEGYIYNNGTVINNHANGVINASQIGSSPLYYLQLEYGTVNNSGLMEATNGGQLALYSTTVNNAGGNITNNTTGTTAGVYIYGSDIVAGTLNNNTSGFLGTAPGYTGTLDGSTVAGAVTINGTYTTPQNAYTYLYGSIVNNGTFLVTGGGNTNAYLYGPANVSLTGGGTVTLDTTTANGGGNAYLWLYNSSTLDNVNNTIQGEGIIYNNGTVLNNHAAGVINASQIGSSPLYYLQLEYGTVNNSGLLEATNGGQLSLYSTTVNNSGGNITNNSTGLSTSGVYVQGTTIQGGNLNNTSGSFFGTPNGYSSYLDGSTGAGPVTINGTYTTDHNANTYLYGSMINNGDFLVTGGGNSNAYLYVPVGVSLTGGSTVTLNTTTNGGGGNAYLYLYNSSTLDNVDNTIQGEGFIYNNGTVFNNHAAGVINATPIGSSPLPYLQLEYGTVNNTGLMEATNGGILYLYDTTVNNAGGNISNNSPASGTGVYLYGNTTIQGGNLNNNSTGFLGTLAGNTAYLDGSTGAGAVTINGTYTSDYNSQTYLRGTINNQGNLLLNGGNNTNSYLWVGVDVSLTGGGTVSLSTDTTGGGGNAYLYLYNSSTLTNMNNTIQGEGIIYNNGTTFINGAAGTVWANSTGSPFITSLTLDYGTVTNNGTFQVSPGDQLHLFQTSNFTNYAANTLTGGAYNIYGTLSNPGTLQIDYLGTTGGEIINNAATIYLNGPNSNFVDQAGLDVLSNFSNNMAAGSFTITNGRNFTSPSSTNFANAGAVIVGSGSTFTTGGSKNYVQSGGSTQLNGSLVAGGHQATFNGGVLYGNGGSITGNVTMAGTIAPAATINGSNVPLTAGQLNITGNYNQTSAGIFNLGLGGLTAGTQFGFLGISGNAMIDGTLNVNLLNSFFPAVGDTFTFLTTGGTVTGTFATTNGLDIGNGEILNVIYGSDYIELSTAYTSTTDLWNGGTGVWNNGSQWSIGVPQPNFDVIIYSGGNDQVTMNVGSSTVSSLTVGGATNGFTSELTDGGVAQTLNITNGLAVGQQGVVDFTGNGSSITAASVSNSGSVTIGSGVTMNLTNQPLGVTSVAAGSSWTIGGNFEVAGVSNTGFSNLSSVGGSVIFENGASQSISPFLTISSSGSFDVSNGTSVVLAGVSNSGTFTTGMNGTGGNTLSFSAALTNDGTFRLNGSGDMATMPGLTNNAGGFVDADGGSTLIVNGNVTNNAGGPQGIYTGFSGTGGNTIHINGNLTNNGMFGVESAGDNVTVSGGVTNNGGGLFALTGGSSATFSSTLNNSGTVDLENGSSLTVNGATTNNGTLSTSGFGGTGGNTMSFTALLTNAGGAQITLNGNNDTLHASAGLANAGTITVKNGSTIDPPYFNNIGTLNIDGTSTFVVGTGTHSGTGYIQLANGTLGEMISSTAFGQIDVSGNAALDGTLDILLQGGFNPAVGSTYDIILFSPGGLSGTFATILNQIFNGGTEIWQINYDNTNGDVQLTAAMNTTTTPEPSTFLLLGTGLMGVAYGVRRRWLK